MNAEEVRTLIAEHLAVPMRAVHDHARFSRDLGADSLDLIELAMRFEVALDISIEDEESEACVTVGDALELLHRKRGLEQAPQRSERQPDRPLGAIKG